MLSTHRKEDACHGGDDELPRRKRRGICNLRPVTLGDF